MAPEKLTGNELIVANILRQEFTREQVAGIMGNLKQEHNFKTDDVPGGLGIAQWLGARRERLLLKDNPFTIETQASFIIEELKTTETAAYKALQAALNVEQATYAFMNLYERCGVCRQSQRIEYAKEYYEKL